VTNYTNRTCHCCGIRKPQPQMFRKEIYVETGKSKGTVSDATWVGAVLGNKQSVNSVNRWLFNTSQRTYMRKRQVWLCSSCAGSFKEKDEKSSEVTLKDLLIVGAVIVFLAALFGGGEPDKKKPTANQNAPITKVVE
jgi:hypothetical protein